MVEYLSTREHRQITGYCPMGCGDTLGVDRAGRVGCYAEGCPRPDAAHRLLTDAETEHLVYVTEDGWTVKHPLRERLRGGGLFACEFQLPWAAPAGVYRAYRYPPGGPHEWALERVRDLP